MSTQYTYSQNFGTTTVSGSTPYGTYDSDANFTNDCQKTSVWMARKMGYPILKVELNDYHLYGAYEEAALKYNSIITSHQATNWFLDHIGQVVSSSYDNFTNQVPRSDLSFIKRLMEPGTIEAGVNTRAPLYTGSFIIPANGQTYDLKEWANTNVPGYNIIAKDIWHAPTPAMIRTPYYEAMPGSWKYDWYQSDYSSYGVPVGSYGLQIWPAFSNVLREQETEMYTTIRRSMYSYVLNNNVIKITPSPSSALTVWFSYYLEAQDKEFKVYVSESAVTASSNEHFVTNIADVPYQTLAYSTLNPISKDWIRNYALAISKEILGNIRGKFSTVPIPGGEVSLDGADLRSEAKEEKATLLEELSNNLQELTIERLMEKRATIAESVGRVTARVPFKKPIIVG